MRLLLQRTTAASVCVEAQAPREIGSGLVILAGFCAEDNEKTVDYMAEKAVNLRIFDDAQGQMNRSLLDVAGDCLIVSQFTLYANSKKGRRPSFVQAAPPIVSEPLYRRLVERVKALGVLTIRTGEFGAYMQVALVNDGPVTILLDSAEIMPK